MEAVRTIHYTQLYLVDPITYSMYGPVWLIVLTVCGLMFVLNYFNVPSFALSAVAGIANSYSWLLIAALGILLALLALYATYFLLWVLLRWVVHVLVLKLGNLPVPADCNYLKEAGAIDSALTLIVQKHATSMNYPERGYSVHYGTTGQLAEKVRRGAVAGVNIEKREIWLNIGWVIRHPSRSVNRTRQLWLKSTLAHEDAHIQFES